MYRLSLLYKVVTVWFFVCVLDDVIFICRFGFGLLCICTHSLYVCNSVCLTFVHFFLSLSHTHSDTHILSLHLSASYKAYELIHSLLHHQHYYYCYDSVWLLLHIQLCRCTSILEATSSSSCSGVFVCHAIHRKHEAWSVFSMNENS